MIIPLMLYSSPGVENNKSLYVRRFGSVFSTWMELKRDPIVPVDSSAARIPLPGQQISLAVWINSDLKACFGSTNIKLF